MKITTKQLVQTALLLAISIVSQFLKGGGTVFVIFVTGAIINACIIIAGLSCNLTCAVLLAVVTPITAFFISPSPVTGAIPAVVPCIMIGNALIAICTTLIAKKVKSPWGLPAGMAAGCVAKAAFMGISISLILIRSFFPEKLLPKMTTFQISFSLVQLAAAAVGCVYAYIIWIALKKYLKNE